MALEPEFLSLSTQTITVEPLSTHDGYGAPSYSTTASTFTAYIEPGTKVVVTDRGVEEVASATVFVFSSSGSIGPQDRVTLPDGRQPRLLRVDTLNDDEGQHHIELSIA